MSVRSFMLVAASVATSAAIGCRGPAPTPPTADAHRDPSHEAQIAVLTAEARRGAGLPELLRYASTGSVGERRLAIRALGRVGGPAAVTALRGHLDDRDDWIATSAAAALGVVAALDEPEPSDALNDALVVVARRVDPRSRAVVIEAIGRAGGASAQAELVEWTRDVPEVAASAGIAFARFGRRKIAFTRDAYAALIAMAARGGDLSYAAVYALARAHVTETADSRPMVDGADALRRALVERTRDVDPEVRVQAAAALAKHRLVNASRAELEPLLGDPDWRVAVEAVRALAGDQSDAQGRAAVATAMSSRLERVGATGHAEIHVVTEALRLLASSIGDEPGVRQAILDLEQRVARSKFVDALARGWIDCLARVARMHLMIDPGERDYAYLNECSLPRHLRGPLIAKTAETVGTVEARMAAARALAADGDPRVQASAIATFAALLPSLRGADRSDAIGRITAAIASTDSVSAGTAVEATATVLDHATAAERAPIEAALLARGAVEVDPELAAAILELIGKRALVGGDAACRAGLKRHRVIARAAATCIGASGAPAPAPDVAPTTPPRVPIDEVIGRNVRWRLDTTRGPITIVLDPDRAPWAVASIVALTRAGFYDGRELHRVVPGFVAQGGDPTESGWGGPGYTLPAEPSTALDGAGFVTGAIGIADAGRDSGGSLWFVMHGRAAHLDGRYTQVGRIVEGQATADALLIGDRVVRATVDITARRRRLDDLPRDVAR